MRNSTTMAKTRGVEGKLARLRLLRKEPVSPAIIAELRKFLSDSSNFVVADAAALAGDGNLAELAQDLVAAFDRFMVDAEETDKLCRAKNASHTACMNLMIYPLGAFAFWVYGFAIGWGNWWNGPVPPGCTS